MRWKEIKSIKVIELFAGIGAFRQGLENQNIPHEIIAFSEIDKYAIEAYRVIHNDYETPNLGDIKEITFMPELESSRGNRWLTAITFEKSDYNKIMKALDEVNVESRPLWKPMHMQKLFENSKSVLNGVSEELFNKGLCLASSTTMTKDDVKMICEVIINNLDK